MSDLRHGTGPDVQEAMRRVRSILAHRDHEHDAACIAEIMLHAEMALVALEGELT